MDDQFLNTLHLWAEASMHTSMQAFRQYNRANGFSTAQVNMLFRIYYHGPASVNDLAEHLGVTKAAVSQLLDKLVDAGLFLRLENPHDRRSKQVSLTDQGRETVRESMRARHVWVEELAQAMSAEDKALVLPGLEHLVDCFSRIRDYELIEHIKREING